jgi:hypothetical protein
MAVETEFTVIPQVEKPFVTPNGKFSQCNIQGAIVQSKSNPDQKYYVSIEQLLEPENKFIMNEIC